jgi:hypothetical protein
MGTRKALAILWGVALLGVSLKQEPMVATCKASRGAVEVSLWGEFNDDVMDPGPPSGEVDFKQSVLWVMIQPPQQRVGFEGLLLPLNRECSMLVRHATRP